MFGQLLDLSFFNTKINAGTNVQTVLAVLAVSGGFICGGFDGSYSL